MATFINTASTGSFTGGTVTVNPNSTTVTFTTATSGTYTFGTVNVPLLVAFNQTNNTNLTITDTSFNRQTQFILPATFAANKTQTLTLSNLTSYSNEFDTTNILIQGNPRTARVFMNNTNLWVTNNNEAVTSSLDIAFTNINVYLGYYDDTLISNNEFTYQLNNRSMCNQCTFNVGMSSMPIEVTMVTKDRIPNLNIIGDVTLTTYADFIHEIIATVAAGKTLTFDSCNMYEYTNPQISTSHDNTLFTLKGNTGNVVFTNCHAYPRISQSKHELPECIFGITGGASYGQINSDATLMIHHLPSSYETYDTLYNNIPVIHKATIDVDVGDYVFGTDVTNPVTFDIGFATSNDDVTNVTLYVNGGNVAYANNSTNSGTIKWTGYVIGRNNQVGGRSFAFNTTASLDISGLNLVANAGNNILNPLATQGTWTGTNWFSYYPNTTIDYSYNLMLENSLIVGSGASPTAIPLYNGFRVNVFNDYTYNFYADSTYRPNFFLGRANDARFDLSGGSNFGLRLSLKGCEFHKGLDLSIAADELVQSDGCTYHVPSASGSSCITLTGEGGSSEFALNSGNWGDNNLYLSDDLNKVIDNQGVTTINYFFNRFHLSPGTWDFNASGLTSNVSYISTSNTGAHLQSLIGIGRKGTMCLVDGTYTFSNVPDLELNFRADAVEAPSTITNSTFTQTIYVFGSSNVALGGGNVFQGSVTAHYDSNPANVTQSSVYGTELINLQSGMGVFEGSLSLDNTNQFYLPHGKKCISPFTYVDVEGGISTDTQVILTSYRFTYYITSALEPLAYELATVYLDNAPSNDVTIFGADTDSGVDKAFVVKTTGTTSDQYLTGRFSRLNLHTLSTQKVILGYPQAAVGRSTESGLKKLFVDGTANSYALDIVGGTQADVNIENVTFNTPGSVAYFHVGSDATGRIDFTSTDNVFNTDSNTKHVGYLESTGADAVLDLGNELFPGTPVVAWNQFYWPSLGNASNSRPLISSQGYVAESWTNDPDYYDSETDSPTMYFLNQTGGLSKPNSSYGLGSWNAGQNGYDDLYFYVAFGLEGTDDFLANLDHVSNFESYVAGAIYDTNTTGVNTKTYAGTQYRQTIRLRFKDDFENLAQTNRLVIGTFTQGSTNLWNVAPVPLIYYIESNVSTTNYTLTTQYTTNGGSNWYVDLSGTNITVSESAANGTANLRFVYLNGSDVLRFLNDTSVNFAVDFSFLVVGPDTDINDSVLSWPALNTSSNILEIKPLPFGNAWTQKTVTATQQPSNDQTQFNVNNVDDDTYLLVSSTSTFTGVNNTLEISLGNAGYNINADQYTLSADFYIMTHVLPPAGTGSDPMELNIDTYLNEVEVFPNVTVDVSGSGTQSISQSDVATPVHVEFTIDNTTLLTANGNYSITLVLDDERNHVSQSGPIVNPINNPITVTINFTVPLYVYLNTTNSRYDQNINQNISKGSVNDLYVYLSSKLNSSYTVNFSLTGDNINKSFQAIVSSGDISANGSFQIDQDNKIWGDASLSLTADVDLVNTVNYAYAEAGTHEVRVLIGRAIGATGYESSGSALSKIEYSIQAANGESHVRTPSDWNQGDAAGGAFDVNKDDYTAHIPISKYTPYFVEVEVASKGFYSNNVNSNVAPTFSISLTDYLGATLTEGTDFIINNKLSNVNSVTDLAVTDLINDTSVNKRLYFRLNPTANLNGDTIGVHVTFDVTDSGTNYNNLVGSYHVLNIDYTDVSLGNMTSTLFMDTAGLRANTWRILPSGDGKYLEFYHDSKTNYITRLGLDASFHPFVADKYNVPGGNFSNGHQIQNYVSGQNGLYSIYDPTNNVTYTGTVVHGFGSGDELSQPWLVLVSTNTANGNEADFGQGSSDFYDMSYSTSAASGNGIYEPFKYFKGAAQVGLVTGSLTSTDPTYWKTFNLYQDDDWITGAYSFYDALYKVDQFLYNSNTDYTDDDTVFQTPSTANMTAEYSGEAYAGGLQLNRTGQWLGNGTADLNYFVMTGDFYQGDNDTAAMAFINRKPRDTVDVGGNDDFRGSEMYGAKWAFWSNDFCCGDTNTSRIGAQSDGLAGLIEDEYAPNQSRVAFVIAK